MITNISFFNTLLFFYLFFIKKISNISPITQTPDECPPKNTDGKEYNDLIFKCEIKTETCPSGSYSQQLNYFGYQEAEVFCSQSIEIPQNLIKNVDFNDCSNENMILCQNLANLCAFDYRQNSNNKEYCQKLSGINKFFKFRQLYLSPLVDSQEPKEENYFESEKGLEYLIEEHNQHPNSKYVFPSPVKKDYTFNGWEPEIIPHGSIGDKTFKAKCSTSLKSKIF